MAQQTALQPYALPGKLRSFSAKTEAAGVEVFAIRKRERRLRDELGRSGRFVSR